MTDQIKPPRGAQLSSNSATHNHSNIRSAGQSDEWPIDWLRQTSPYINTHRGKTFVIWLGSDMFEADGFSALIHDLTLLSHLGVRLVIVHGMRLQIDAELERRGISADFGSKTPLNTKSSSLTTETPAEQTMRITGENALAAVRSVVADLRCKLESAFSTGLPNSPMSGAQIGVASGNFIVAKPYGIRDGIDFQHTGEVRKVRNQSIQALLDAGMVILLSPIGYSRTGEMFNLLSEEVAMQTAIALRADKLMYLHQHANAIDSSVREISAYKQPTGLINLTPSTTHLQSLQTVIENSFRACRNGVDRSHVVDATCNDSLLRELFTRDGSGLLIDSGDFDNIRVADTNNVDGIMELITPLMEDGTLLQRSKQDLEREIHNFYIIEREGSVICCASLENDVDSAELACLAVHPDFRASGKASDMLQHLVRVARERGCATLFVLSSRSGDWFIEQGFNEDQNASIPDARRTANQSNSKIYTIPLTN